MEKSIVKGLSDKLYEKRKATALELQKQVSQYVNDNNYSQIDDIINELCRDYAYALHQPMARTAGLMGLAAVSIALGTNNVTRYLSHILPPVLACFSDQNDQVRFYACESLYNIAKIAKGEMLVYFNEIFDVLCKISADNENSVRGASELLDRLIKDIVAERASSYISVVNNDPQDLPPATKLDIVTGNVYQERYEQGSVDANISTGDTVNQNNKIVAFSLPKFIPLLSERIYAINPDTRTFLVDWIKVLLNNPDLELITYLPAFLGGLFSFLDDSHEDVKVVTHELLNQLLSEVVRISKIQKNIKQEEKILSMSERQAKPDNSSENNKISKSNTVTSKKIDGSLIAEKKKSLLDAFGQLSVNKQSSSSILNNYSSNITTNSLDSNTIDNSKSQQLPGDVSNISISTGISNDTINNNNHNNDDMNKDNIELLKANEQIPYYSQSKKPRFGEEYIPGQDIHIDFSNIIEILINNLSSSEYEVRLVSLHWIDYLLNLAAREFIPYLSKILSLLLKLLGDSDNNTSESANLVNSKFIALFNDEHFMKDSSLIAYSSLMNSLTLQFFDSKVDTKIACLDWLLLIYKKSPDKILEQNENMIMILLKSLSDNDTRLTEKSLGILNTLCIDPKDIYLKRFLHDLLDLLRKDSKLFKTRANYIIRQICTRLSSERIYKAISSILDTDDDIVFSRMMIQILSANLVTSQEAADLRKKLRYGEDTYFFNILFKLWCHNPVSVLCLCFVAENYELAYNVLQCYVNYDLGMSDLVQLDMLVQLLESPVFTRLRLQLLEQQKFPYLYKCLYGILMILPQSKAFDILNRRLSSITNWVSQSSFNNTVYGSSRNGSHSTIGTDSSQRSVSKNKYYNQELLDHFNKVLENERPSLKLDNTYDVNNETINEHDLNIGRVPSQTVIVKNAEKNIEYDQLNYNSSYNEDNDNYNNNSQTSESTENDIPSVIQKPTI
ncbi:hypothetical protein TPHA_0B02280 [Tetrapisispora phaffii CBS 4417]|uniref:Vacuolar protein 14 C-terminal Fig4-binding domain-containing protein n=1 Tax=Tetrapisispora phaffii (strain ATCC 24235 / CBS 4417 / NBRC 1672 / NRRL Y-8282 / UCD 70-5) TaxID=1071381 RepID=G8BPG9_TETPH|nr:hypothetical protein TPHA_0B02280 [Tetrapisispora phaffii CBS 4417]CCE61900.1 hypothetical protein TPHA_0B02280 [Tetrapisispora phaffii CBS 4417]